MWMRGRRRNRKRRNRIFFVFFFSSSFDFFLCWKEVWKSPSSALLLSVFVSFYFSSSSSSSFSGPLHASSGVVVRSSRLCHRLVASRFSSAFSSFLFPPPLSRSMELVARHTYKAQNSDELSFKRKDKLQLLSKLQDKGAIFKRNGTGKK